MWKTCLLNEVGMWEVELCVCESARQEQKRNQTLEGRGVDGKSQNYIVCGSKCFSPVIKQKKSYHWWLKTQISTKLNLLHVPTLSRSISATFFVVGQIAAMVWLQADPLQLYYYISKIDKTVQNHQSEGKCIAVTTLPPAHCFLLLASLSIPIQCSPILNKPAMKEQNS